MILDFPCGVIITCLPRIEREPTALYAQSKPFKVIIKLPTNMKFETVNLDKLTNVHS